MQIPVKLTKTGSLAPELGQVMKHGFACLQTHYLEFSEEWNLETCAALLNLLMLNYDNFLTLAENKSVELLDKDVVKIALEQEHLKDVISEDMKLYAVDILFKKK